jgi:hypothetical protein
MSQWTPDLASPQTEGMMEAQDLPEGDRDQVRRFAEFLRRRKARLAGESLPPAPEGMRAWLLGES